MQNSLVTYLLHLADNALILGHRNSEWCGHGPVLEQDIAITNISLDLIGQARNFYQYAASLSDDGATEDSFAYFRDSASFRNVVLTELPRGDWAFTVLRQFFFSLYQRLLFDRLITSTDAQLSAIAAKSLKEVSYHLRWSSEWVIRLGDGTEESNARMNKSLAELWGYTPELFVMAGYESELVASGISVDVRLLKSPWLESVKTVFAEAGLPTPPAASIGETGKEGAHTVHLTELLGEFQAVARAHPGANW